MGSTLEQVQIAIDSGAHQRALELALTEWNRTLAPEIAAVAQREAARALETYEAPPARRNDEFQLAWLERAKQREPLTTAWLSSMLGKKMTIEADYHGILDRNYAHKKYAALFARLDALKLHAPSPLVAEATAALVAEAPYSAWDERSGQLIYRPLVELLVACKDVRQLPLLKQLLATPRAPRAATRDVLADLLPPAIEALGAIESALGQDERARWLELLPGAGRTAEGGQAFLDAVVEKLEDDDRRLVYADWLAEGGDPRGEFITIQVREAKGTASDAEKKRARALLKTHEEEWLGDLGRVFSNYELARGFLDAATLAQNAAATPEVWKRAAADPRLRTLTELNKGRSNTAHLSEFVLSSEMVNLRSAPIPANRVLEQLCAGPPRRIEELQLAKIPKSKQLAALASSGALPRLQLLAFELDAANVDGFVELMRKTGTIQSVRRLRLVNNWDVELERLLEIRRELFDTRLFDELHFSAYSYDCTLRRTGAGFEADLEDRWGTFTDLLTLAHGATPARVRYVDRGEKGDWASAIAKATAAGTRVEDAR